MRKLNLLALLMALLLAGLAITPVLAHDHDSSGTAAKHATKYACPMGCKTMDKPGKCPVCGMQMDALPDDADADADTQAASGDPYYLTTSPTGRPLGDKPVIDDYNGRQLRFASAEDEAQFNKNPDKYLAQVDKKIIADQAPLYPLTTCPITGEALDSPVDYVYNNRLVRFCCAGCISEFEADPAKYLTLLDAAAKKAQVASYPLDHCLVETNEKIDGIHDNIIAGRLFRFCCPDCVHEVEADPAKYISQLDAARAHKS
jgi:YHS domain-containing protein